jgi:hypothetical protein
LKIHALLVALLATTVLTASAGPAPASNGVVAVASTETSEQLEYKAATARWAARQARLSADDARANANRIVAIRTSTKGERNESEAAALQTAHHAMRAEAAFDQAESNAATVSVKNYEAAELHARRAANDTATAAVKARAGAEAARRAVNGEAAKALNSQATKNAMTRADTLELAAYRLEFDWDQTLQSHAVAQEYFTKAKARVIAGRAIAAHRGIKGHLSLPLSMPLSPPILGGKARLSHNTRSL